MFFDRHRGMFLGFFVAGALFIVVLKALGWHQVVVTLVPILLMVAYAWTLWDRDKGRPRYASAGDNIYYLGFLYTLVSMAFSLYQFSMEEGGPEAIVTNFGIAIFTTIFGMAGRILIARQPDETDGAEDPARSGVAEAARQLRGQFEYTVDEFKEFRARINEALDEGFQEVRANLAEAAVSSGSLGERLKEIEEKTGALQTAAAHWTKIASDAHRVREALMKMTENIANFNFYGAFAARAVEAASGSLQNEVEARAKEVRRGTEELRAAVKGLVEELGSVDLGRLVSDAIGPTVKEMQTAAGALAQSADAIRTALETERESGDAAGEVRDGLVAVAGSLSVVSDRVSTVGTASQQAFAESVAKVQKANERLVTAMKGLEDLLRQAGPQSRRRWWSRLRIFGRGGGDG